MKLKLIMLMVLCASLFTVHAQTEKGKILLGGHVIFLTQKGNSQITTKQTTFSIGPSIGFFVAPNFALGTGLNYSYNKSNPINYSSTSSSSGSTNTTFGIAPFARYYVGISPAFKFFGEFNASGNFGETEFTDVQGVVSPDKSDYTSYTAGISPGLAFFASKKIAVQLSIQLLSYVHQKVGSSSSIDPPATYDVFSFAATTSPAIGVNFHF